MKIEYHIRELLLDHNFVIVPGLGAFVAKYKPAEVDFQGQKILPPSKSIYFNDSIKEDDGLLIHFLCHKTELTKEEGYELIENYVKDVEKKLSSGNAIEIDNLGHLELNMNKKKEFKNNKSGNLLLESFGLPIVEFSGSDEINEIKDEKKLSDTLKPTNRPAPVKSRKKPAKKKGNHWIYIFSVLVLLSLMYLAYEFGLFNRGVVENFFSGRNNLETNEEIILGPDREQAEENSPAEEIENALESRTTREIALAPDREDKESANSTDNVTKKDEARYYLIAGSFMKYSSAEVLLENLIAKGYQSTIIKGENGRYRVTFNSYSSKEKALEQLNVIKKRENNSSVWILKK